MVDFMQDRYIIANQNGKVVCTEGTTVHLSEPWSFANVKVFKEYRAAEKCMEKHKAILGGCHVEKVRVEYKTIYEVEN